MVKRLKNTEPAEARVLVVDDEADVRQVVTLSLQQAGLVVSSAENVAAARTLLEKGPVDVIVSDVMMPGEDGITFLMQIHQAYPEIPVILMTGQAQLQMALDAIRYGAFEMILKPFDFGMLNSAVDRALAHGKLLREEKGRRIELESELETRTDELKNARAELDFAHSKILKVVTQYTAPKENPPPVNDSTDSVCRIFSKIV